MPLEVPGFDGGDRTSIALPKAQRDLLDALEATGKPVVIVLQSGSAVALGENGRKANAILEAWYPGEKGGQAIAEVLRGTVNRSEEHTSELQSLMRTSYAVFCLKTKH